MKNDERAEMIRSNAADQSMSPAAYNSMVHRSAAFDICLMVMVAIGLFLFCAAVGMNKYWMIGVVSISTTGFMLWRMSK